jgi:hypothetical protein
MRTWARVSVRATSCGGCGRELHQGDPVLFIDVTYQGGKVPRRQRCDQCEGPAPPDLPAFVARSTAITPTPLTKFAPVLPLGTPLADFRRRQSGDREPGEEG